MNVGSDRLLQNLKRDYVSTGTHEAAMRLAGALLRIYPLEHYQELAAAGNLEAQNLLMHMRAIYLFEDVFDELHQTPDGRIIFTDPATRREKIKYVNVYCHSRPLASVEVRYYQEALDTKNFLETHFRREYLMPPEQLWLDRSVARMMGEKRLAAYPFNWQYCISPHILIEDEPCFDFTRDDAPPIKIDFISGRLFHTRPLTEEDYTTIDDDFNYGTVIKNFEYSDLPEFARPPPDDPMVSGEPAYVVANLVTRQEVRDIDGTAWANHYEPIAKIYLGYIYPFWIPDGRPTWYRTEEMHTYTCQQDQEAVMQNIEWSNETGGILHPRMLEICPQAGILQTEDRHRDTCRYCGNEVECTLHAGPLVVDEYADEEVPPVPESVNETIYFLSRLYSDRIYGDISSVLGGQDLSVGVEPEEYGPKEPAV